MTGLTRYILKQATWPLIMFTAVLTLLVWLTQSLQMLDLLINRQQSGGTFFLMTLYVMPSLLTVILPFALFCASLYALQRLSTDSELVVMGAAGVSPWAIAKPMLILALIAAAINMMLNLYLMPAGYRQMKDRVFEIRTDIASNMIRDGQFTNPVKGLTIFNRVTTKDGTFKSLLIHDNRDKLKPKTYLAKEGRFENRPEGLMLMLIDGSSQEVDDNGNLTILEFERNPIDISQFSDSKQTQQRELTERYLHELLWPDLNDKWDFKNRTRLYAEGHNRLASPAYNIAFVLIALCAMTLGGFNRRGYAGRIAVALAIGLVVRLAGFGVQSLASKVNAFVVYQYLLPSFVIFGCIYLLMDMKRVSEERWEQFQSRLSLPVKIGD